MDPNLITRAMPMTGSSYDPEKHMMRAVLATENPASVYDWDRGLINEVLLMSGCQMPQTRQIPLLDCHGRFSVDDLHGSCRDLTVDGDKLASEVHFAQTEDGMRYEKLAADGHLTDLSLGYRVLESVWIDKNTSATVGGRVFTGPLKVATKWMPKEGSMTPIGADEYSKFRSEGLPAELRTRLIARGLKADASDAEAIAFMDRMLPKSGEEPGDQSTADTTRVSDSDHNNDDKERTIVMKDENTKTELTPDQIRQQEVERVRAVEKFRKDFGARVNEIDKICDKAINDGQSIEQLRGIAFMQMKDSDDIETPVSKIGLEGRDLSKFSVREAILAAYPEKCPDEVDQKYYRDISDEIEKRAAASGIKTHGGILIPYEAQQRSRPVLSADSQRELAAIAQKYGLSVRDLSASVASAGGNLIGTQLQPQSFIELLRAQQVLSRTPMRILPGLTGNQAIPRQTAGSTFEMITDGNASSESDQAFDQVTLSPKIGSAHTIYPRLLLQQATPGIDMIVEEDLAIAAALGMDSQGLQGSGAGANCTGIINVTGIGATADPGTNFDWGKAVDMETDIFDAEVTDTDLIHVMTPSVRGTLKKREIALNFPKFLIDTDGLLNGYPVIASNQMPAGGLLLGAFRHLVKGEWGVVEIVVDPFYYSTSGKYRVTVFVTFNYAVRHPGAFSYSSAVS